MAKQLDDIPIPNDLTDIDSSLLSGPLAAVREDLESLHLLLDNFVAGKTGLLKGDRTRNRLNLVLQNLDQHLAEIDRIRAAGFPPLKGRITEEMVQTIKQVDEHRETLNRLLYESIAIGEKIPRTKRSYIHQFLNLLKHDLASLRKLTQ